MERISPLLHITAHPPRDVEQFHDKFGLHTPRLANLPDQETHLFRMNFLHEELGETENAYLEGNISGYVDGLLDLIYVAYGTLLMAGIDAATINACWNAIQRANMSKERASHSDDARSTRKNSLDVVKPEGWEPPDIEGILRYMGRIA